MAWWYIPAALAAAGALKGSKDAKTAQGEAVDRRNLYAAMARANLGSQIPGGGFVGTPASQGEGMLAGGVGGFTSGLGITKMAQGLGMGGEDAAAPAAAPDADPYAAARALPAPQGYSQMQPAVKNPYAGFLVEE